MILLSKESRKKIIHRKGESEVCGRGKKGELRRGTVREKVHLKEVVINERI